MPICSPVFVLSPKFSVTSCRLTAEPCTIAYVTVNFTVFGADCEVTVDGNVFAATCYLQGLAVEEIDTAKLAPYDEAYPVIVGLRARKGSA